MYSLSSHLNVVYRSDSRPPLVLWSPVVRPVWLSSPARKIQPPKPARIADNNPLEVEKTAMTDILLASELDEREVTLAALEAAEEQLQSLCASHAGTFVSVERRGRALQDALQELQNAITSTQGLVQTAQTALDQEEGDSDTSLAVLAERHRVRRRTLLQHSSLLELLELPSLMDACVRSNLYEDALSIATFANTLQRRHKDQNLVVGQVIQQIRSRQSDLRRHLLQQLKLPVTMPQCLEVVTALRRLNSIDLERHPEGNLERLHHAMELRLQVDFWRRAMPGWNPGQRRPLPPLPQA